MNMKLATIAAIAALLAAPTAFAGTLPAPFGAQLSAGAPISQDTVFQGEIAAAAALPDLPANLKAGQAFGGLGVGHVGSQTAGGLGGMYQVTKRLSLNGSVAIPLTGGANSADAVFRIGAGFLF